MFTGLFDQKAPGEYRYLSMEAEEVVLRHERPPCERLGREVSFEDLPEVYRAHVMDVYQKLWDL